jgi:hypothetical protein
MLSWQIFGFRRLYAVCFIEDLEYQGRWREFNGFDHTTALEDQIHQNGG